MHLAKDSPLAYPAAMHHPTDVTHPRYFAWLMVLVYFLNLPGVAPAALIGLVAIGSEHEVQVTFDQGHLDIVLHHIDDHHEHVHGELAKLMNGTTPHNHENDHVLHFATSNETRSITRTALNAVSVTAVCVLWQGIFIHPALTASEVLQRHAAGPPPGESLVLTCLRTTVFLV